MARAQNNKSLPEDFTICQTFKSVQDFLGTPVM